MMEFSCEKGDASVDTLLESCWCGLIDCFGWMKMRKAFENKGEVELEICRHQPVRSLLRISKVL